VAGRHVREVYRPGAAGCGPGSGRGPDAQPQPHRYRAHPLGLIHEGEGVAARALESLGISLEAVRQQLEEVIGQGEEPLTDNIPFSPRGKKAIELSLREALQLGHNYIGTEHILLALMIRQGDGVAANPAGWVPT